MIKNLKIRSKLTLLVAIAIIFTVSLVAVSIYSFAGLGSDIQETYDMVTIPTGYANDISLAFGDVRAYIRDVALTETEEENEEGAKVFETANAYMKNALNEYDSFLTRNNITSGDEYNTVKSILSEYAKAEVYAKEAVALAMENEAQETLNVLKTKFTPTAVIINGHVKTLVAINQQQSEESNQLSFATVQTTELLMVILTVISLIVLLILTFVIVGSITKPVGRMVTAAESMAKGDLNINLTSDSKDEIGVLSDRFIIVSRTFNSLVDDLDRLSKEHAAGDLDARIDTDKYSGAYSSLADGLNDMLASYVNSTTDILDCVGGFGNGNFDAPISKYPGKKARINSSIEALRSNMNHVSGDIQKLVGAALEGNLELRADAKEYKGDWAKIISGLNDVMNAIFMPLNEASTIMSNLANGDFSKTVDGNYKGAFGLIKDTLNMTVANISSYIKEISDVLTEISHDNLDVQITNEYVGDFISIKDAINGIADKLNMVMSDINSAAEQVASGAKQISESSMSLAQGASEQASSVEELTATITSVNEQTRKNAENSQNADNLSTESKENAAAGNVEMENMLNSIQGIKESSDNISNIIKVIETIATQTNLLALNAAVEAARAGQYGKGFAVVAEEVRSLAVRSQNAVRETAVLIEDSINKVEEGTIIAGKTSEALTKIVSAVSEVSEIISEINIASNEQALSISQIMEGTGQISTVVQQNSATSEESAAAAQQLSSQAELLRNMIATFKLKKKYRSQEAYTSTRSTEVKNYSSNQKPVSPKSEPPRTVKPNAGVKSELKPSLPPSKPAPAAKNSSFTAAKPVIGTSSASVQAVKPKSAENIYGARDFGKY